MCLPGREPDALKVLWFGLGRFGFPIAERVLEVGIDVMTGSLTHEAGAQDRLLHFGARRLTESDAKDVDAVVTILPTPGDVSSVATSILGRVVPRYWIDMSSGTSGSSIALGKTLAREGVRYFDAPGSGSQAEARQGGLTMWVGCQAKDLRGLSTLLDSIACNQFFMGDVGNGCAMKLVNQCIHIQNMIAIGEGLTIANRYALPEDVALASLLTSSANSAMLERFGRKINSRDTEPQFRLALAVKDVRQAVADSNIDSAEIPSCVEALRRMEDGLIAGWGESDFSILGWPRSDMPF